MGDPGETTAGDGTSNGGSDGTTNPPVVHAGAAEVGPALARGAVVAVPAVGGYSLAVQVGTNDAESRLEALAADPDGPHYAVGHRHDVRALTSGWSEEVERLLERCWPGPVDVFLPRVGRWGRAAGSSGRGGRDPGRHRRVGGDGGDARKSGHPPPLQGARALAHHPSHVQRALRGGTRVRHGRRRGRWWTAGAARAKPRPWSTRR